MTPPARTSDRQPPARWVGKQALLALLRSEGVDVLFGNPGSTELALMDALAVNDEPRFVLGLHEGIVMSMAHGFAASTGRLTAAVLHAAPGLGNAMGMLYNVKKAGAPVLVLAGQQDTSIALREPLLWDDLATMARPLVKWSVQVERLVDLPRIIRRAAKVALTAPTGPVFVSLPGDVLAEEIELDLLAPSRVVPAMRPAAADIDAAARLIARSSRPAILAGDSVCQGGAVDELVRFAETIGAPVHLEPMADRAAFPTTHPLYAGLIPRLGPAARKIFSHFDLVLSVGADLFTESLATGVDPIGPDMTIVHIDTDPWELAKTYPTDLALLADPGSVLPELRAAIEQLWQDDDRRRAVRRRADAASANAERRRTLVDRADALRDTSPMAPVAMLKTVGECLPPGTIVIDETLSSGAGITDLFAFETGDAYFGLRGGGIGVGLPQAVGIKLALPDRPVVALVGDGSAMFSIQTLWTAAHENLSVVFIIVNNASYRILKQRTLALDGEAKRTGRLVGMDLDQPRIDFVALAGSLGVSARRVETTGDLRDAVTTAFAAGGPRLIDAAVERTP